MAVRPFPRINVIDTESRWQDTEDEMLWWPRILWIDPGGVSGVAVTWFDPNAIFARRPTSKILLAYAELFLTGPENGVTGQVNHYLELHKYLDREKGLAVGCESFIPRRLDQSKDFLSPVRIRAALDYPLSMQQKRLHVQSPSDAINTFSNDRLKQLRMYSPGPDHVNDAKRHTLLWIRNLIDLTREDFAALHGDEEGWWSE